MADGTATNGSTAGDSARILATEGALDDESFTVLRNTSLELYAALKPSDDRVVWAATQELIEVCMTQKGLSFTPDPYPEGGNAGLVGEPYPPQNLLSTYGYNWNRHLLDRTKTDHTSVDTTPTQNPDADPVLGSCYGSARSVLGMNELALKQDVFFQAQSDIIFEVASSQPVVAAVKHWAQCMAAAGYRFATPDDALREGMNGGPETPAGVATAMQDIDCQREAKYGEARTSEKGRLVQKWLDDNPGAISDLEAASKAVVERALASS